MELSFSSSSLISLVDVDENAAFIVCCRRWLLLFDWFSKLKKKSSLKIISFDILCELLSMDLSIAGSSSNENRLLILFSIK